MGYLLVKGNDLELIKLDTNSGNISIKGLINSITYLDDNNKEKRILINLYLDIKNLLNKINPI